MNFLLRMTEKQIEQFGWFWKNDNFIWFNLALPVTYEYILHFVLFQVLSNMKIGFTAVLYRLIIGRYYMIMCFSVIQMGPSWSGSYGCWIYN
jgi:hypothetical protein